MSSFLVHPETTIGWVALTVADMARSLSFYEDVLGFVGEQREADVALRAGNAPPLEAGSVPPLILLTELPGAQRKPKRTTGLYHYAIRLPDRAALARMLLRLSETGDILQGASDHGVSEALYLSDPDGNGIEIYRDRPEDAWPRREGELQMIAEVIDAEGLLTMVDGMSSEWHGMPAGTDIGHVHLHVADLDAAQHFYCDGLGFTLMQRFRRSALFVSAGGYHHHIGLNTWAGVGAPSPPGDAVGLRYFALRLPDAGALDALVAHCAEVGIATTETPEGVRVADLSANTVLLTTML